MKSRYGLEIRAASTADAQGVSDLLAASGRTIAPTDLAERLEALRHTPGTVLLAAEWGPPSGLVALHWYRSIDAAYPKALVTALLVAPDDRRRGIGRLLVKAAAQSARSAGCGELALLMRSDQPDLRDFCLATGFEESGLSLVRPLRKRS